MEATSSIKSEVPRWFAILGVTAGLLPWLGIVARVLTADQRYLVVTGFGLWLAGAIILFVLYRSVKGQTRWSFTGSFFAFTFTFASLYSVCVLVVGHFLRKA